MATERLTVAAVLKRVLDVVSYESVIGCELALRELAAILADEDASSDLPGLLAAWEAVCRGAILPSDRPIVAVMGVPVGAPRTAPEDRARLALKLAEARGRVTLEDVRDVLPGQSDETLRTTFAGLVRAGKLRKHRDRRWAYYTPCDSLA